MCELVFPVTSCDLRFSVTRCVIILYITSKERKFYRVQKPSWAADLDINLEFQKSSKSQTNSSGQSNSVDLYSL